METTAIDRIAQYFTPAYLRRFKRLKPLTRLTYFTYISKYLERYGANFTEKNVEEFLESLPKSSRAKAFFALKDFAISNGYGFPFKDRKDFPEDFWYSFYDRQVDRFTIDELKAFADACINRKLTPKEAAAVVLCMIYGIRRVELMNFNPVTDFNPRDKTILIKTAKKGKKREHYVPTPILPYLWYLKSKRIRYPLSFFESFPRISRKAGVELKPKRAWHAFRRSLVTDLLETGLPDVEVYDFLRWSRKEVIYRYYVPNPKVVDEKVFKVHPYLPFFTRPVGRHLNTRLSKV